MHIKLVDDFPTPLFFFPIFNIPIYVMITFTHFLRSPFFIPPLHVYTYTVCQNFPLWLYKE